MLADCGGIELLAAVGAAVGDWKMFGKMFWTVCCCPNCLFLIRRVCPKFPPRKESVPVDGAVLGGCSGGGLLTEDFSPTFVTGPPVCSTVVTDDGLMMILS